MSNTYIPIIGLEVHIELSTKSKMFCRCSADHFGKKANTITCPTCLGLPGAMPKANTEAIKKVVLFGISFDCNIRKISKFDRKHYFYPDLPKGYQISQYDMPICENGYWRSYNNKIFHLKRIHLEEDTGKLIHHYINSSRRSLIDFNRSGVPLMEIVTEPEFNDSKDVLEFLKDIQTLSRYLNISNADMEKGSMRLEANISLRNSASDKLPNYKVELKNINSFRFLQKAIDSEIERQNNLLNKGVQISQETRGYDEKKNITFLQRSKEEAKDYRYFPEPDLDQILLNDKIINSISKNKTETPWQKRERFIKDYRIKPEYAEILCRDIERSDYFEKISKLAKTHDINIKTISDLIINRNIDKNFPEPQLLIIDIIKSRKSVNLNNEVIDKAISDVISEYNKAVDDYKEGKIQVLGYLIGMVQKKLEGNGNINIIKEKLIDVLNK